MSKTDLFGTSNGVIRTLGLFQPFGTLMMMDKVESRWIRAGKKPPFPLGEYLIYTTKKPCSNMDLYDWCRNDQVLQITELISKDETKHLNGYAIGIVSLVAVKPLTADDNSYVKFVGTKTEVIKDACVTKTQWGLHVENRRRIEPFEWRFGKQGTGFVPDSELQKIKILC